MLIDVPLTSPGAAAGLLRSRVAGEEVADNNEVGGEISGA